DMSQPTPTQELVARDLHGWEWRFKHIFRGVTNSSSVRSIFQDDCKTGALEKSSRVTSRDGATYAYHLTRATRQQSSMPSSVISSQSMHLGVLATASHAVQWDEPASIDRPDRVSLWEIEPFVPSVPSGLVQPIPTKNKRPRPPIETTGLETALSTTSAVWNPSHGPTHLSGNPEGRRSENNVNWHRKQPRISDTLMNSSTNCISRTHADGGWLSSSHVNVSGNLFVDGALDCKSGSAILLGHSNLHSGLQSNNPLPESIDGKKFETVASCRLFGVDLNSPSTGSISNCGINEHGLSTLSGADSDQNSDFSKVSKEQRQGQLQVSPKEVQIKQNCPTRSRTKVQMQGIAVGRAVDLTALGGYDELIDELEEMFEIKGGLCPRNRWEIVFTDDEGDTMLMGDDPWPEFCTMVRRIFICSSQDVKKLSAGSTLSLTAIDGEGAI
ncbi:hypothetical protein U1Q18_021101, partial [Sarracenia purpurea var. burkii]